MSSALQYEPIASAAPLAGSKLRMIDMIGAGVSGTVFRAELNTADGPRQVAIKVPHRGNDLRREASAIRRFPHPNVVSLLNEPATSSDPLILELCNQGTLEDRMADQPLPLREVKHIVSSIGSALSMLHDSGWLHGDVNPSNIGFGAKGVPCLFDFGCARPADGSPPQVGTTEYCGDSLRLTSELDVRSLAATAMAALSPVHETLKDELDRFVTRADDGEAVTIDQLVDLLEDSAEGDALAPLFPGEAALPSEFAFTGKAKPSTGGPTGPPRPRTREFGPRPQPPDNESTPRNDSEPQHRRVVGFLLLALVLFGALTLSSGSDAPEPVEPAELFEQITPAATLDSAGATWSDQGVVTVEVDGLQRTFAAGQAGDVAAIADWNCDGDATLGIYRPSTGAWFMFDSWEVEAMSAVQSLGARDGDLAIRVDGAGCADPVVDPG